MSWEWWFNVDCWFPQMDALISHSSKSYYACVGESTHAYQSPSKDLTAINNRLNGYCGFYNSNKAICILILNETRLIGVLFPEGRWEPLSHSRTMPGWSEVRGWWQTRSLLAASTSRMGSVHPHRIRPWNPSSRTRRNRAGYCYALLIVAFVSPP